MCSEIKDIPADTLILFWCRGLPCASAIGGAQAGGPTWCLACGPPYSPGHHTMLHPQPQPWRTPHAPAPRPDLAPAALGQVSGINTKLAGRRTLELLPSLFPRLFRFSISLFFVYVFGCFCIVRYENSRFRRFFFFLLTLYWCRHLFFFFVLLGFFNY